MAALSIKCKNCKHIIYYDEYPPLGNTPEWQHKYILHNENCECRNPEPNLKIIQNKIKEVTSKIDMKKCREEGEKLERQIGIKSLTIEDWLRPFTI